MYFETPWKRNCFKEDTPFSNPSRWQKLAGCDTRGKQAPGPESQEPFKVQYPALLGDVLGALFKDSRVGELLKIQGPCLSKLRR